MIHDRDYYRSLPTARLIETAKEMHACGEVTIALVERLEAKSAERESRQSAREAILDEENADLTRQLEEVRHEADSLIEDLHHARAELARLQKD
jgi:hypothetical protein